jgi:predicted PurR-regulated permease PerM
MNFFKIKTTWSNAEFIPLKLCIATVYILIGSYFHNFFRDYYVPLLIAFGITIIWSVYLWLNKMKKENKSKNK